MYQGYRIGAVLLMGGAGVRFGNTTPKQFCLLGGKPLYRYALQTFFETGVFDEIVLVCHAGWMVKEEGVRTVVGGATRQESSRAGLGGFLEAPEFVVIHDAVRPFVDLDTIRRVIEEAAVTGAAIVGIVPVDTVKQVSGAQAGGAKVRATISRERLILAQTPQVFRYDVLRRAFEAARRDNFYGTDESSLVERLDQVEISVVLGSDRNIKITRPSDMDLARLLFEQETARR